MSRILNLKREKKYDRISTKKPKWEIHAYFLDACNCDWGCPCQFNAKPTHSNCEGIAGYHILNGSNITNYSVNSDYNAQPKQDRQAFPRYL